MTMTLSVETNHLKVSFLTKDFDIKHTKNIKIKQLSNILKIDQEYGH